MPRRFCHGPGPGIDLERHVARSMVGRKHVLDGLDRRGPGIRAIWPVPEGAGSNRQTVVDD